MTMSGCNLWRNKLDRMQIVTYNEEKYDNKNNNGETIDYELYISIHI